MERGASLEPGERHRRGRGRVPARSERAPAEHVVEGPGPLGDQMRKVLWSVVMAVALVAPALAHHSPAAFDRTKKVTLVGTVKEFRWQNPHTWIEVEVPDDKGKP